MFRKTCCDMNEEDLDDLRTPPCTIDLSLLSEAGKAKITSLFESDFKTLAVF